MIQMVEGLSLQLPAEGYRNARKRLESKGGEPVFVQAMPWVNPTDVPFLVNKHMLVAMVTHTMMPTTQ